MSNPIRKVYEAQQKVAQDRLTAYNETTKQIGDMFTELAGSDDEPTLKELLLVVGTAIVQSNIAVSRMIAVSRAEADMMSIAVAAGYLTPKGPPTVADDSDVACSQRREALDQARDVLAELASPTAAQPHTDEIVDVLRDLIGLVEAVAR